MPDYDPASGIHVREKRAQGARLFKKISEKIGSGLIRLKMRR